MVAALRILTALIVGTLTHSSFAMKPTVSKLQIWPRRKPVDVTLPFLYHSPTEAEKARATNVQEGCVTTLEKEGDCAFVGFISPCQLAVLHNTAKTIVGHIPLNASKESFLTYAQEEFAGYDLTQTTGTLFTADFVSYEEPHIKIDRSTLSLKDLYQGRTQLEELKHTKDGIVESFGIKDRTQINASKFKSALKEYELGAYEYAEICTFIKHNSQSKPLIHSICPMAENILGNFQHLKLNDRRNAVQEARTALNSHQNPYLLQMPPIVTTIDQNNQPIGTRATLGTFTYGNYPCVKI
jgi:hypothetical protein